MGPLGLGSRPAFPILGSKRFAESAVGDAPARRLDLHGKGPDLVCSGWTALSGL